MLKQTIENIKFPITVGTAIVVILGIVTFSVRINGYTNRIEINTGKIAKLETDIEQIKERQNAMDVTFAEIKARLTSIDVNVLEMRKDLKIHLQQK